MMFKLDRPIYWLLAAFVICVIAQAAALAEEASSKRPNIVLFLVDDMGWQDTSVPFHTEVTDFNRRYRTPHMEQLAKAGMKFTQVRTWANRRCTHTLV